MSTRPRAARVFIAQINHAAVFMRVRVVTSISRLKSKKQPDDFWLCRMTWMNIPIVHFFLFFIHIENIQSSTQFPRDVSLSVGKMAKARRIFCGVSFDLLRFLYLHDRRYRVSLNS